MTGESIGGPCYEARRRPHGRTPSRAEVERALQTYIARDVEPRPDGDYDMVYVNELGACVQTTVGRFLGLARGT